MPDEVAAVLGDELGAGVTAGRLLAVIAVAALLAGTASLGLLILVRTGQPHWLIVLLIVVMVFGTKKLKNLGSDLGGAVKGFKDGMKTEEEKTEAAKIEHAGTGHTIDGEVKDKAQS